MKKLSVFVVIAVLTTASTAKAQGFNSTTVGGGPHDLSAGSAVRNAGTTAVGGQTCIFCHVPHGGANAIPLWNRAAPSGAAYQLYTSSTLAVTPTGGASAVAGSGSGACLSCHDGTIAMDVLSDVNGLAFGPAVAFTKQALGTGGVGGGGKAGYTNAGAGSGNVMTSGLPWLGTDLRNDHPVTIVYETARAARPGQFVTQVISGVKITVGAVGPVPLYGASTATATIECASCHDSHNNSLGNFLRKSNAGSAICLSCHIK